MRIIGGTAKGRRLASFKTASIRPTTDKVREAIFNILQQPDNDEFGFKKVLDIFAGTGAMGIEALSRGAERASFIDSSPKAIQVIKKNLELCAFTDKASIIAKDAISALEQSARRGEQFDLIFIDPPYIASQTGKTLNTIAGKRLLAAEGIIVAESSKRMIWDGELNGIELFDRRRYGDTVVSFYKYRREDN
ncbi:MAG: 16S rRNA (guanine(966)-N(2))-methyltransferase RsmD [Deltaproteobacteria bacterium]|nr:16S rRNA (guanine(966)-N(2))-methyltransferase RsmD [Deltaproteobacteria bacterium]